MKKIGLNADEIIQNNNKSNICLQCGKEITGKNRFKKKFCDSSCAAKYNNRGRVQSEETKKRTSKTLKDKYKNGELIPSNLGKSIKKDSYVKNDINNKTFKVVKLSELIHNGLILNPNNVEYDDYHVSPSLYKERLCVICGKKFQPSLTKNGRISVSNTCSDECHKKLIVERPKESARKIID